MTTDNHRDWIKPFLKRLAPVFREILVMSFFVNTLALAVPVFTLQVYDRVVGHAGISTLVGLVLGMGFIVLFDFILRQARSRIMQTIALRVDAVVGRQLYNKFTALPLNVLETRTGNYWQALFRDVDVVRNTLSGASAILMCDLPFAIMFFGVIWVIAKPIAWVLMIITPVFLFVTYRAGASTGKASAEERAKTQDRDTLIGEMIHGRTTIKALALEGSMRPIWEERHAENIESAINRGSRTDLFSNLGQSLTMTTTVMMTSVGAVAIVNQELTMGALIATNMLAGRLIGPLNQLVGQWRVFAGFKQSVERLGEVFAMHSERQESEVKLDKPTGSMGCAGVTFSYAPGVPPVCDNITVQFRARGIHALVGRNGSGKTTLLKILQGLYVPDHGRVLLDGADITQFSRAELAQWMGYVPQESTLFAGTVRDNIIHRFPGATDEQIIRAAKAAGVHEFIIDMPDGYGTEIGEAGQRLSGGQRQRIAIARALIGDPAVLLLDEPSSSLDRHAEHELRDTLKELSKNHTIIIVTHSPILLAACDNLIALDKGKVALAGPATDILPRLFGGGSKEQAVAAAAAAGRKTEATESVRENKGRRAADKTTEKTTAKAAADSASGGKKPMAAPKLGGPPPGQSSEQKSQQKPEQKSAPAARPKGGVKPVAKRPSAPQQKAPTHPASDHDADASGPPKEAAPSGPPTQQSPAPQPKAPQPPQAPQPSEAQPRPPSEAPKTPGQPPLQGAQRPAQGPQASPPSPPQTKPQSPPSPAEPPKRPTAQAVPPPGAKASEDGSADDDDDPYSAALRDMIRSDH